MDLKVVRAALHLIDIQWTMHIQRFICFEPLGSATPQKTSTNCNIPSVSVLSSNRKIITPRNKSQGQKLMFWVFFFVFFCFVLQMISPGYYSQECNAHKQCKDPVKYCHMFLCVDCLKENVACTQNGQCCPSSECIYGRCKTGATAGQAGEREYLIKIILILINYVRPQGNQFDPNSSTGPPR